MRWKTVEGQDIATYWGTSGLCHSLRYLWRQSILSQSNSPTWLPQAKEQGLDWSLLILLKEVSTSTSSTVHERIIIICYLRTVPEVPSNVDVVQNVVLWKPPKNTNGNITGYRLMISDGSTTHQVNRGPNAFFHLVNRNGLSQTSDVTVRVSDCAGVGVSHMWLCHCNLTGVCKDKCWSRRVQCSYAIGVAST